jgi:predicted outer membrane repeat protein
MLTKNGSFVFRMFSVLMFLSLLFSAVGVAPAYARRGFAGTRYAKPSATGTGDCSSWANACTLQTALAAAVSGNEIWVMAGTHKPTTGIGRGFTFQLVTGVAVYGGFTGTETALSERDPNPATNGTILSGNINILVDSGSYHVVTGATGATLDGFTITAGDATGASPNNRGGGMYNINSSPTLANIIFSGNSANYGGGMYNSSGSSPTLMYVTFSGNTATNYAGGGMCNEAGSSPTLTNVTFSGNSSDLGGNGGGMSSASSSNPILINVTFSDNSATYGGGMSNINNNPTLTNVTFNGNSATNYGGGMYNDSSSPALTNVTFSGNSATNDGGGMRNDSGSNPTLTNVTFSGNLAAGDGGGMRNAGSSPMLTNVTFSANTAINGGGMFNTTGSNPEIRNTIFWGNTATTAGAQIYNDSSTPLVSDSIVQDGYAGGTNIIITDSKLSTLGDYGGFTRTIPLLTGSSAIDTGNDAACPATDQRGRTRPQGAHCDIGAYETNATLTLKSAGAQDGWILESTETSEVGGTLESTATTFRLGDDATDKQYRAILHFDTSDLPDNAVITNVTFKIKKQGLAGANPFTTLGKILVDIRTGAFSNNNALQFTDFQAAAHKNAAGIIRNTPVNNWYSVIFPSSAFPFFNMTGVTQFRLRFQIGDNDNATADTMKFFSGNYATASAKPTLVIEYYVP